MKRSRDGRAKARRTDVLLEKQAKVLAQLQTQVENITKEYFEVRAGLARAEAKVHGTWNTLNVVVETVYAMGLEHGWWTSKEQYQEMFSAAQSRLKSEALEKVKAAKEANNAQG